MCHLSQRNAYNYMGLVLLVVVSLFTQIYSSSLTAPGMGHVWPIAPSVYDLLSRPLSGRRLISCPDPCFVFEPCSSPVKSSVSTSSVVSGLTPLLFGSSLPVPCMLLSCGLTVSYLRRGARSFIQHVVHSTTTQVLLYQSGANVLGAGCGLVPALRPRGLIVIFVEI